MVGCILFWWVRYCGVSLYLEIEVEGAPSGGLMLGNGSDDGNVVFGVRWIQQGVETTRPWRDFTWKRDTLVVLEMDSIGLKTTLGNG